MKSTYRSLLYITLAVLATVTVSSCCSVCRYRYNHPRPIEHTVWHLVKLGGESLALEENVFNLRLENGRATLAMACNTSTGTYSTDVTKHLSIRLDTSTQALCPEYGKTEEALCRALQSATHYDVDYDMLLVISNGAIKAVFKSRDDNSPSGN